MNKKWLGAMAVCLMMASGANARGLTFSVVQIQDHPLFESAEIERGALDKAFNIHNLMIDIGMLNGVNHQQEYATKFKKSQLKKMQAFENCAMRKMMKSSKDAKSEWAKKKEAYHQGKETTDMEKYAEREQALTGTEEFESSIINGAAQRVASLSSKVGQYMSVNSKPNLMQARDRKEVMEALQKVYDETLKQAEAELAKRAESPDDQYEADTKLLLALKSDRNGEVFFTKTNASDFDKLKAESQIKAKMMSEMDKLDKMIDLEMSAEEGCEGGV